MPDCIFCKIINRKLPAKIEYEDEDILAFFDIKPAAKVHIIIVPKKHIASVNELTEKDASIISKMALVGKKLAKKHHTDIKGYKFVINTGLYSGQTILHLHMHLLGGEILAGRKILEI